jgi:hypothetical protein
MRGLVSARFSGYPKSETRAFYTETGCVDAFNPEPDFA